MTERNKYEYMIVMIFYNICCIADPQWWIQEDENNLM
jgi:hypothetical protein